MNPINRFVSALRGRSASSGPASSDMRYEVANPARGTVLATRMKVAGTAPQRSKGLLGREGLAPGEGLWIVPCESVHTFFMRFSIDLVYLDRKNKVKKVRSDIGAWRMSACLSAHSVLELPAGTIRNTHTQPGDTLEFSPGSWTHDGTGRKGPLAE
jgi:uncharacterized membrane protein (UPF0127 family)